MLCRCCRTGTLGGCFAVKVDCQLEACSIDFAVSLHHLLLLCCILVSDLVDWGFMVEVPPRVFLAVRVCLWGFVGNPGITYESFVSLF
jgi:hypothetical protein